MNRTVVISFALGVALVLAGNYFFNFPSMKGKGDAS